MTKHEPLRADAALQGLSAAFELFKNHTRLEILCLLSHGPLHVSAVAKRLELSLSVVSHHLNRLAAAAMATFIDDGRARIYSLGGQLHVAKIGEALSFTAVTCGGIRSGFVLTPEVVKRLLPPTTTSTSINPITPSSPSDSPAEPPVPPKAAPRRREPPEVVTRPAKARVPRGDAPSPPRPATGPQSA